MSGRDYDFESTEEQSQQEPRSETVRRRITGGIDAVSSAVVSAVAAATGDDVDEIEPLNDVVDPDALANLFRPRHDGSDRAGGTVTFDLHGCRVHVRSNREVVVRA